MFNYISLKVGKEVECLELNILKNFRPLSKAQILSLDDSLDEQAVDDILTEFEIMSGLCERPIYQIVDNKIQTNFSWRDIPEYFLCLYYSYYGATDKSGGTDLFERISGAALKNFINGEVIPLGFPANMRFNDNLDRVAEVCYESRNMRADSGYKDDGVDVVGYKSFGDRRSSNLYVLLQCAAGIHWTQKKGISLNRWTNYIVWYSNNIIESISTVEYVKQKDWEKRTSTFGMLLDRLRIYNFLYQKEIDEDLRRETLAWCQVKINELDT